MNKLGTHIILDLYGCDFELLNSINRIEEIFKTSIDIGEMNLISYKIHEFKPYGVSGIFLIAESHLSFHSQPEYGIITLDIYSCGDENKCETAINFIMSNLKHSTYKMVKLDRGDLLQRGEVQNE